jgi:hypothetical protein
MPPELAVHPDTNTDISQQVEAKLPGASLDASHRFQQETAEGSPVIRLAESRAHTPGLCLYNNSSW